MKIESLNERALMQLCALLFKAEGFEVRQEVPLGGNLRADLILQRSSDAEVTVVEVRAQTALTVQTLQQLSTYMKLAGADRGLLITSQATPRALLQELRRSLGIELWTLHDLERRVSEVPEARELLAGLGATPVSPKLVVNTLALLSYRGFPSLALQFEARGTTALIGVNGAGKSSVLQAVSTGLSWLVARIRAAQGRGQQLAEADIRNGDIAATVALATDVGGAWCVWTLAANRPGSQAGARSSLEALAEPTRELRAALEAGVQDRLPIAVYYPVNRSALDIPKRIRKKHEFSQLHAYDRALEGGIRDFRLFFEWFRGREDLENERRVRGDAAADPQLQAVRSAVSSMLPGFSGLRVERSPQRMVVNKGEEELIVDQLSDGEKCLLSLVGDLARRLAIANPGLEDPLQGTGVVLIDEVDLHLHPQWQRQVIPSLERTFPELQFIVSTHSPLVLSEVPRSAVRILDQFKLVEDTPHVQGRDSNAILWELMGVPEHPEHTRRALRAVSRLLAKERWDEAREAIDALAEQLGDEDVNVVRHRAYLLAQGE